MTRIIDPFDLPYAAASRREGFDTELATADELEHEIGVRVSERRAVRVLIQEAIRRFPDDERFARWAELLAPPRVSTKPADPGAAPMQVSALSEWLAREGEAFVGQWVAVEGGRLVASAETYQDLVAALDPGHDPYVFRVVQDMVHGR